MPTTIPKPNERIYKEARENEITKGGFEPPAPIPRPPLAEQERREVRPEAHPGLARGGAGAKDAPSGRIRG